MSVIQSRSWTALALLLGLSASAQQAPELAAGFTQFRLAPSTGGIQALNGVFLTGIQPLSRRWSLEGDLRLTTGTDAANVCLNQGCAMVGPRYTWKVGHDVSAFAHVLAGWTRLKASQGALSDQSNSVALAPGLGLDVGLCPSFALRGQVDGVFTRYGDHGQRNLALSLGLVYRGFGRRAAPITPAPKPLLALEPAPVLAPLSTPISAPTPQPTLVVVPPAPPASAVVQAVPAPLVLNFACGRARLTIECHRALSRVVAERKEITWVVSGYASAEGKPAWNRRLSQRRADAVAKALVEAGIPASAIRAVGKGTEHPVADNATRKGRALNRRAELGTPTSGSWESVHAQE